MEPTTETPEPTTTVVTPEQSSVKIDLEDPASPYLFGILACGFIDNNEVLHTDFVVQEMDGNDEDLLAARGPILERMNAIITNCLVRVGTFEEKPQIRRLVSHMAALDRMIILLTIRRAAHGDIFKYEATCPKCTWQEKARLNLANLAVTPMPNPLVRKYEVKTCRGNIVKWHVMMGSDDAWLIKAKTKDRQDLLSMYCLARIDAIKFGDEDWSILNRGDGGIKESMALVKRLKSSERQQLRRMFEQEEGNIDTEIEQCCPSCNHEYTMELNVQDPDFFFPSAE